MLEDHIPIVVAAIKVIELCGVAIIAIGAAATLGQFLYALATGSDRLDAYSKFRTGFGRAILLGLEFLVAADIINTITIEFTLQSVLSLGAIVLIRTFLSWSIEVELEGRWPWQSKSRESNGR